jgi:hypothetical protein
MGLLDGTTNREYYQGSDLGNYQFTSLSDIINQFMVVYVGENKMIPKASKVDVAFHAQRALRELSFDVLKSVKSQQIDLPPTLVMPLPHDYVNYTKLSWADSAGIKHPLYPTNSTNNPFQILQNEDKSYDFTVPATGILKNGNFTSSSDWDGMPAGFAGGTSTDAVGVVGGELVFEHGSNTPIPGSTAKTSRAYAVWQKLDVTTIGFMDLSALGKSAASATGKGVGTLRVGVSTLAYPGFNPSVHNPNKTSGASLNNTDDIFDIYTADGSRALITFDDGLATSSTKALTEIDVSGETEVYVLITSYIEDFTDTTLPNSKNVLDDIVVSCDALSDALQEITPSSTWDNYKANTPSENQDDYQDDTYWPANGERYGLDPQHAQVNGSFYIDPRLGRIHFSSNISGKTVILDYISDSLGTDAEMQVHKFAEDAMYKWITHAILSASSYGQPLVSRLTKEKFAAVRKAKLRLSNIKLEELTQILRGKSKQIKH